MTAVAARAAAWVSRWVSTGQLAVVFDLGICWWGAWGSNPEPTD
jgi:hypothetical protein